MKVERRKLAFAMWTFQGENDYWMFAMCHTVKSVSITADG